MYAPVHAHMPEKRKRFDFPKKTTAPLNTELNRRVYSEGEDRLDDLRERVSRANRNDTGLSLTRSEHSQVTNMLRDKTERAEDVAERMDANIFGDTEEQAEIARDAQRGLRSDPTGEDVVSVGRFDIPEDTFEEATRVHADRSQTARAQDESSNAPMTTDLDKWSESPGRFDFPGIDTVGDPEVSKEERSQASEAHRDRSMNARRTDSSKLGVVTTDADVYESDPGRFDFPGVDTPDDFEQDFL